jgi:hypothetical protein
MIESTENTQKEQNTKIKAKEPVLSIVDYLSTYFTLNPEKLNKAICFIVINKLPDITASIISDLRKKGLSYDEIASAWGYNLGRGTIHRLEAKTYFPKKPIKQLELIKKVLELI